MKTSYHFQPTMFFCFIALMFAAGCNFNRNNDMRQEMQRVVPADTFEPTGNAQLDSMLLVAATAPRDTNLVLMYYKIGNMYENVDYNKAKEYFHKLKLLSEQLDWSNGRYLFASGIMDVYNREGLVDSAIVNNQQALELAKKEMNEQRIAQFLGNVGVSYYQKRWYETALKYYGESLALYDKLGQKYRLAHLYYLMSYLCNELNMQEENLNYSEKALDILSEKPDTLMRANVLISYAAALAESGKLEKVESVLLEALRISTLHNNKYTLGVTYSNLGNFYLLNFELDKAEIYIRKSLEIVEMFSNVSGSCPSYRILSEVELCRKNFDKSEKYAMKALEIAIENDLSLEQIKCYHSLSKLHIALHDFRSSQMYTQKSDSIETILTIEKTRLYAKEMEAKYETEKKELKISALEEEKRLMTWLSIAGGGALLLGLVAALFLWRWTVQKRRLAETRIKQLEQEKQLIATQAVLDGETQERARLARDLHDGLGSLLTGVRLHLQDMQKGAKMEYAEVELFDKALGLVDRSVREMRRVAHNLMPDALSRFGLKPAVGDLCGDLPSVEFIYYGDESRLEPNMETMIYRCVYELVNNALKHAGAAHIIVQIMQRADGIAFTVQDDGCGFDPATVSKGAGLQNIRTRVDAYNGILNIDSKLNEGTEVNVELRITNSADVLIC